MTDVRLISDTHGLLRPQAEAELEGADLILHAGDLGRSEILVALNDIAPTRAIRGNVDMGPWADALPLTQSIEVDGLRLYMIHDQDDLRKHPPPSDCAVVLFGHSHRPLVEERNGILFVNPGSAGPRRFSLPVTMARFSVRDGQPHAEIIELQVEKIRRES